MDRLTKPKEFLTKLHIRDCDYMDDGMTNHIADLLERYHAEQLSQYKLQIKAGKSYKLKHPNGSGKRDKIHIDYILDNTIDDSLDSKIVVCRCWSTYKQRWFYYAYLYSSLAIYNGWQ